MSDDIVRALLDEGYTECCTRFDGPLKIRFLNAPKGVFPSITKVYSLEAQRQTKLIRKNRKLGKRR